MKGFKQLCGLQLKSLLNINKARFSKDPKEKRRAWMSVIVIVFLSLYFVFIFGVQVSAVSGYVQPEAILSLGVIACIMLTLITSVASGYSVLFGGKDHDAVLSLPVGKRAIVLSRLLLLYVSAVINMIMFVPGTLIAYIRLAEISAGMILSYALMILTAPMVPIALGSLISVLLALFSTLFKKKNIIGIITNLLFFFGMFFAIFFANTSMAIGNMASGLGSIYPPLQWFIYGVGGNWAYTAVFVLLNLASIVLLGLIAAKLFGPLYDRINAVRQKRGYKFKGAEASSISKALYRREWRRFTASPIFVLNVMSGPIMGTILCIGAIFFIKGDIKQMVTMPEIMPMIAAIVSVALGFFVSMSPATSCLISAEGNRLWLLKSLPVSGGLALRAKLRMNNTMMIPFALLNSTIALFVFDIKGIWILVLYLVPVIYALFSGVSGLWSNLLLPKLDWKHDTEFVKQGASVLVSVLVGMVIVAAPMVLLFTVGILMEHAAQFMLAWAMLLLLISIILRRLLSTRGTEKFRQLDVA
jgi:ABC-2 type transport system permease protein